MSTRIAIIGGHGKIARLVTERKGDVDITSVVRNPDHVDELSAMGAHPVVLDVETAAVSELAEVVKGHDAVVFLAGAGGGSGVFRKYTSDLKAAITSQQAAKEAGVSRFVQVSFVGAEHPTAEGTDPVFAAYWDAKRIADDALRASDLDFTIVKPGRLTDEPETGKLSVSQGEVRKGSTTARADVANFILHILEDERTYGKDLDILDGDTPLAESLDAYLAQ
ncbi:hypothetical protein HMPREF0183_2015 [Brevibacterium mcbrellneri ATCC 49030]|uniref:NAD(P)-binding domain-containing protein n=1 Tax=Brevibacterium mcbrellneri ATCC 49030 TaxID=585530 RepID=D4YQ05_9MICO|nr:NAD(P)-binding oxidoreductase [Brevibacterium mcbrellneri]EFG46700.1 hypothetical protein HMPREF0183_2015 [Brevibacterium mcbrellneri ATCC 49030]